MYRRLLGAYLSLLAAVLIGLVVPLSMMTASRDTQAMFIDRLDDTTWFASQAEAALRTSGHGALDMELRQYHAVYDIDVAVIDVRHAPVLLYGARLPLDQPPLRTQVDAALLGEATAMSGPVWPWQRRPLVVAEPIFRDGEVVGAAVTVSPTDALRAATWRSWMKLAGLGALAIAAGVAVAVPLTRWVLRPVHELNAAAHALAAGRKRWVGTGSGPPELRRLVESFNAMAEKITTLIDRQRSFASYAGHQLRTPLATLRIALDDLAAESQSCPRGQQIAVLEVERLAAILDAMLRYAQVEAIAADVAATDVAETSGQLVALRQPVARRAGVDLSFAATGPLLARAAPTVVEQAIDALVDNAVKYAGPRARVGVRVAPGPPGWVDLAVADNGPGMSAAELAHAVEPFWRRPGHDGHDGVGLGLAIIDGLVRATGGHLHLHTAHPHGVEAVVRLPAAEGGAGRSPLIGG